MCCLSDTRRPQNLNKCVYIEKLIPRGRRTIHLSIYEQLSWPDTDMTHMWPRKELRNGTDQDMAQNGLGQTRTWTWTPCAWTKISELASEYFDILKLPSHVFPGPLIYALPLKLNLYFNLIEFEIDFHTSAPSKFQIFERSKSPPSQNFNFIKFSNFFSLSKNKLNFNTQPFYNGSFGGKTIVVQFKVLKSTLWP